jgi:hypothetical protein
MSSVRFSPAADVENPEQREPSNQHQQQIRLRHHTNIRLVRLRRRGEKMGEIEMISPFSDI